MGNINFGEDIRPLSELKVKKASVVKFQKFPALKHSLRNQRKLFTSFLPYKKKYAFFLFVSIILLPLTLLAQTGKDSLHSLEPINSYILKEIGAQAPLMSKDIERPVSPASLTKILTCTMAIESGRLEQDVLITQESTMVEPSKAGFKAGERIKLHDLVKAAMVNSSNDAAFAIAIYLSGNVDSFVSAMNTKAKMIGMKNSRFTNPAGFDKGIYTGNISTAGDLLRLTEYAVKNPVFNEIARLDKAVFTEETTHRVYSLKTHNKLLDKYPYAVGIKTGYTTKAGGCLIARAVKNNKDLLLVMLNAKTDRWHVAADMFDMAFFANKPDPAWIVTASHSDSDRADTVSPVKAFRRKHTMSKIALRSNRHNRMALSRSSHKTKRTLLLSNAGRKTRKHDLAFSKQFRKNKKKITLSLKPVTNDQAYRNLAT
ncbi:MAG: D-alanyl-D-alanine carboxypeptidase [Chlorobiaceae bacterium]